MTHLISSISQLPKVTSGTILVMDTETTGLNKMVDVPFLVLIKVDGVSYALPDVRDVITWLNINMPIAKYNVFHNAKYDIHMLLNAGLDAHTMDESNIWCTMVAETLINDQHKSYSLDNICQARFNEGKNDDGLLKWLSENCGGKPERKAQMKNIVHAPVDMVALYGVQDINLTNMLYEAQVSEIDAQELNQVFNLEMNVLKSLVRIERRGVPIHIPTAEKSLKFFENRQSELESEIENLVGFPVNVRSGKQMEKAFNHLGYEVVYNEDTGNPCFNVEVLSSMDNELTRIILEKRVCGTMVDTFLSRFLEHVQSDGRIHGDFNQTKTDEYGVITGRLSASNPNLQQIPKRDTEKASIVRSVFCAPKGYKWVSADWKQFEFRVFAHYSNDPELLAEFHRDPDADYHQIVANLTGLARNPYAKQLNLGLVFGMGQGLMAKKCGLPYTMSVKKGKVIFTAGNEAKRIFDKYHNNLPRVKKMLQKAEKMAISRGYVKTIMGRRIHFSNPNHAYKAGGYVFQGTSADLMKLKLVELDNAFRNTDIELIIPVHDEFDFIVPTGMVNDAKKVISDIMEDMPMLRLPIRCDVGVGSNWWEASK